MHKTRSCSLLLSGFNQEKHARSDPIEKPGTNLSVITAARLTYLPQDCSYSIKLAYGCGVNYTITEPSAWAMMVITMGVEVAATLVDIPMTYRCTLSDVSKIHYHVLFSPAIVPLD